MKTTSSSCALRLVAIAILFAAASRSAQGKAAFAGKDEMVRRATVIAVVTIDRVEPAQVKGTHWTYGQKAFARLDAAVKGTPPAEFVLHGDEDFICARCHFTAGKVLVFLVQDNGLYVGCNWHLSVRPVARDAEGNETVEWFKDDKGIETEARPLKDVLEDVRKRVAAAPAENDAKQ